MTISSTIHPGVCMGSDQVWDAKDVANFLKMSRSWVYLAAERNELPHSKLGSALRFDPEQIRLWFKARESRPATVLTFGGR